MQDIDRVADVQALSEPPRRPCSRIDVESAADVRGDESLKRIGGHCRRKGDVGQNSPIRPPKLQRAVWLSGHMVAVFVRGAVVSPTEQCEIGQRRRAARGPMPEVMALAEP
jgi:hypothetical protein